MLIILLYIKLFIKKIINMKMILNNDNKSNLYFLVFNIRLLFSVYYYVNWILLMIELLIILKFRDIVKNCIINS